jgi:enoyl-CoA hydratase/carnithine racemase
MCLRAKPIDDKEAENLGLITNSVENKEKAIECLENIIKEITENSPSAIKLGLEAIDKMRSIEGTEKQQFLKDIFEKCAKTTDAQEGMQAFIEKRKAVWTGE